MPTYSFLCTSESCAIEYEEVLPVSEYQKPTNCPKCGTLGKKIIRLRQSEPTFTDKIFPYYDKALNRVFENKTQRQAYLKRKNLEETGKGSMTRKQERAMFSWRNFGKDARHALKD